MTSAHLERAALEPLGGRVVAERERQPVTVRAHKMLDHVALGLVEAHEDHLERPRRRSVVAAAAGGGGGAVELLVQVLELPDEDLRLRAPRRSEEERDHSATREPRRRRRGRRRERGAGLVATNRGGRRDALRRLGRDGRLTVASLSGEDTRS